MRLFHIVEFSIWVEAVQRGEYRPASVDTGGFVHFAFADQVAGVAESLYRDVADLCVVEIDPSVITHEIRVEDSYGSGTKFPHVYGPIPTSAAVATHALGRDAAGGYTFSPGDSTGPASTDR
ncbi:MAG: DUF952 domain-containing protein [Actinomycetota bacterium]|nr:DUF952 domain-containing protein [Actinomycetota bacterium]